MKTNIDTIRKDLLDARKSLEGIANANWRDFGDGLNSLEEFELWARSRARYTVNYINEALAALSTIDPDAKPQEPSEGARDFAMQILDWTDPLPYYESETKHVNRAAALITAHDNAIRLEGLDELLCAAKATLKATDRVAFAWNVGKCGPLSPNSCYIPDIATALDRLRSAILSTEPAIVMHDLDPKVADCVQKNFSELIGTEPEGEKP